jgi:hypothetical protein
MTSNERRDHSVDGYGRGRGFGLLGLLVGLILLIVVAAIGYNIGLSAGAAAGGGTVAPVAPLVYGPWFFGGFHILGFLFFFLILFLIFAALFRGRRWGGYGWHGGYGPGPWGWRSGEMRDVPPPFEPMLESWHKRAHGETPSTSQTPPPGEHQS